MVKGHGRETIATAAFFVLLVAVAGCLGSSEFPERPDPPDYDYHEELIWSKPYPTLVVDIDYVEDLETRGLAPTDVALGALEREFENVTAKDTVRVEEPEPFSVEDGTAHKQWTREQVRDHQRRTVDGPATSGSPENGTIRLHALYMNGYYETDSVLGESHGSWVVLFPDTLHPFVSAANYGAPPLPPGIAERALLIHEAGHSLGLVSIGAPMLTDRLYEDDECACHSNMEDSVMHPSIAVPMGIFEMYEDNEHVPYKFDKYDRADLQAVRDAEPNETRPAG